VESFTLNIGENFAYQKIASDGQHMDIYFHIIAPNMHFQTCLRAQEPPALSAPEPQPTASTAAFIAPNMLSAYIQTYFSAPKKQFSKPLR
jgi:hypothetical protein